MRERLLVFLSRVYAFVFRRRLDEDFDRELSAHLDLLTDDIVRSGVAPREARRLALIRLGGPMQIKEARMKRGGGRASRSVRMRRETGGPQAVGRC